MTTHQPPSAKNGSVIWIAALAVVIVLGIIAVVLSRGGDDKEVTGQTGKVSVDAGSGSTTTAGDGTSTTADDGGATLPKGALPTYDATTADDAVGMTIPKVTGQDFDGNDITIGPDGKAKIILFVAHWCPHCQREIPLLKSYLDDNPMPESVELLTVSTSVKPGADNYPPQDWLEREGWSAPVLADDENSTVAQTYGLSAFPYFVAVDKDGKVVTRATGELPVEAFAKAIEAARTGKLSGEN